MHKKQQNNQSINRAMFATMPHVPAKHKPMFEDKIGAKITQPTLVAQMVHGLLGGKQLPTLFTPNGVR